MRVKAGVWVRFRVRFRAFSNKKLSIFSRGKMTSCHSDGRKQVTNSLAMLGLIVLGMLDLNHVRETA